MASKISEILAAVDHPNVRKYLNMVAQSEGVKHGYATGFGNTVLESLADHPRTQTKFTQTDGKVNTTSAAGRYQFLGRTWDGLKKQFPNEMRDFGESAQDFAATALLKNAGALNDVIKGDFSKAINKTGAIWASLPTSPHKQNKRSWGDISGYLGETVSGGGGGGPVNSISAKDENRLFLAYKSGAMTDQQAADYLRDVKAGHFNMPKNAKVKNVKQPQETSAAIIPDDLMIAYNDGTLSGKPRADFERDFKAKKIVAPEGITFTLFSEKPPEAQPTTLLGDIGQGVTKFGKSIVGDGGAVDVITGLPKAVYGIGEAVASGALGMGTSAVAGLHGIGSGVVGLAQGKGFAAPAAQGVEQMQQLLQPVSVQPVTNAGQAVGQILGATGAEFQRGGSAVADITGSPLLGAGFETLGNALGMIAPVAGRVAPRVVAGEQAVAAAARRPVADIAPQPTPQPRPAQQAPIAPTSEGLAAQAETMQRPIETPITATTDQAATAAPTVAESAPSSVVEVGKPAIWRNADTDTPVVVKNIEQQAGSDGKTYARVEYDGKDTFVPSDELFAAADTAKQIELITPQVTAVAPELLDITRSKPIEGGQANLQQARHDVLRNIGLSDGEIRAGAVSGDSRVLGQEKELAKADTEAGQAMQKQLDLEQQKLTEYGDNIVRDTGGTFGAEAVHRGSTVVTALDQIALNHKQSVSREYELANERSSGAGIPLNDFMSTLKNKANFKGGDGLSVQRDVFNVLRNRDYLDKNGQIKPLNATQAEGLRQEINESWDATKPQVKAAISTLVGALDESVIKTLNKDEYAAARARHKQYKDIFENPKGIAKILDADGPNGINRSISLEKIGEKMRQLAETDSAQFEHIKQILSNLPTKELQAAADKALGEIRAQIAERITSAKTPAAIEKAYAPYRGSKIRQIFGEELANKLENYVAGVGVLRSVDKNPSGTASMMRNVVDKATRGAAVATGTAVGGLLSGGVGLAVGGLLGEAFAGRIKSHMLEAIDAKTLDKSMSPKQFEVMQKVYEVKLKALGNIPEMRQAEKLLNSGRDIPPKQLSNLSRRIESTKQWLDVAKLLTPEQRAAVKKLGVIAWLSQTGQEDEQ